jgi:nitrogen regulatory protein PII
MQKIYAVIQPSRLDAVIERLLLVGIDDITVSEVRGFGRTRGHGLIYKGSAYEVSFVPKLAIEWVGPDEDAEKVARAIEVAARTGTLGDGLIFVNQLDYAGSMNEDLEELHG